MTVGAVGAGSARVRREWRKMALFELLAAATNANCPKLPNPAQTKKEGHPAKSQVPRSIARSTKDRALFLADSPIILRLPVKLGFSSVECQWPAARFRLRPASSNLLEPARTCSNQEALAASAMLIVRQKALVKSWCKVGVNLVTQLSGSPCKPSQTESAPSCRTFAAR